MTANYSDSLNYIKKQIKDLIPGDIILHPIYRTDGFMLINKNKRLSDSLIKIIKRHVPATAPVLVSPSPEVLNDFLNKDKSNTFEFEQDLAQVVKEFNNSTSSQTNLDTFLQKNISSDNAQQLNTSDTISSANHFIASILSNYPIWTSLDSKLESVRLKNRAGKAKQELLNILITEDTFTSLFNTMREYDDIILIHSINTACISLMIGLTLELKTTDLTDLAIAALFSNIGFTEIPKNEFREYLKKPQNSLEPLNRHLEIFSNMTSDSAFLRKKSIIYGILEHHEYYNGLGYPAGKKGKEISLFGRILMIAHSYDELVGGYNYSTGLHPWEALKNIFDNKERKFDWDILNIFIHRTTYIKLGETLFLPNNQKGEIIDFQNYIESPHLPIVKLENGKIINLLNNIVYNKD